MRQPASWRATPAAATAANSGWPRPRRWGPPIDELGTTPFAAMLRRPYPVGRISRARYDRSPLARTRRAEERRVRRLEAAQYAVRRLHGSAGHPGLSRNRRAARAGHAAQALEPDGRQRHV